LDSAAGSCSTASSAGRKATSAGPNIKVKGTDGAWEELAKSKGWGKEPPHRFYEPGDIYFQYGAGALCSVIGLGTLIYWLTQINRRVKMDDEAVTAACGKRIPFDAIIGVGKKLWDKKGIAKVRYMLAGKQGEFVVDDYKFDTKPSRQILEEIEKRLTAKG
jgi:hypothetical protein